MPIALITGISGQDGSYLTELLLSKGYKIYGIDKNKIHNPEIIFLEADLSNAESILKAVSESQPNEFYNLAAISSVAASWKDPYTTTLINSIGVVNCLEAIRKINPKIKFFQAGSSEEFGEAESSPQNEKTPLNPINPYARSKTFAHEIIKSYRKAYNLHASVGILFNHESERRELGFVSRKITNTIAKIKLNKEKKLILGNMDAKRDWGHAKDYVEAMWLMLQQPTPEDYIIGTGEAHSVRDFVKEAFSSLDMNISFSGEGINEKGYVNGELVLEISPDFFRPTDTNYMLADSSKAHKLLNWKPKVTFKELVKIMVLNDLEKENKN